MKTIKPHIISLSNSHIISSFKGKEVCVICLVVSVVFEDLRKELPIIIVRAYSDYFKNKQQGKSKRYFSMLAWLYVFF